MSIEESAVNPSARLYPVTINTNATPGITPPINRPPVLQRASGSNCSSVLPSGMRKAEALLGVEYDYRGIWNNCYLNGQ